MNSFHQRPVVQKPINANLGLMFKARLNLNPRLKQRLNLTLLVKWVNLLIGRLTRVQNGRRRSEKRKHKILGETNSVQRFDGGKSTSKSKF